LGKLVPKCLTILCFTAARDDSSGSGDNWSLELTNYDHISETVHNRDT